MVWGRAGVTSFTQPCIELLRVDAVIRFNPNRESLTSALADFPFLLLRRPEIINNATNLA